MNYPELLKVSAEKFNSIVSLGMDPVIEDIPVKTGSIKEKIISFYESILNCAVKKNIYPAAVKPNYAFYAQYGIEGIEALQAVINLFKSQGLPVILDAKRGDISTTALAYARECFDFFEADAVTLSPYMGYDSISPFIKNFPDKGYYILNKTSNKSSSDFQDIDINGVPLFMYVSKKIVEWYSPGIGAVVGATYPEQLADIADFYYKSKKEIPLLIPGIGSQGGSLKNVLTSLKKSANPGIHRINSSSGINYAYKKFHDFHFSDAAIEALKILNDEINALL